MQHFTLQKLLNIVENKELVDAYIQFLDTLPTSHRRAFLLRYWYVEPISSIAEKLGFSGLPVFLYVPPQGNDAILFEVKIPGNIIEKLNWLAGE